MKRREVIAALGGAMAWPLRVYAQHPTMPVIGFLNAGSSAERAPLAAAFSLGLYVDGQNVVIEYRWAEGRNDRLQALAADLVHRQVTVIAATTALAALAAKAATTAIPIVFEMGFDPVSVGLVANLNRPGGNITGVTQLNTEVTPKRLELLHELLPKASVMALLVNPGNPTLADAVTSRALSAARSLGVELHVLDASSERDFDGVFANVIRLRAGGLVISSDAYFNDQSKVLASLAAQYALPAVFERRAFVAAGGLASYSGDINGSYRLTGVYVARILQGEKPGELPVQQATKVELFLNLKTAKALAITVPPTLLARADEVIE